jgi:hypothetical protein
MCGTMLCRLIIVGSRQLHRPVADRGGTAQRERIPLGRRCAIRPHRRASIVQRVGGEKSHKFLGLVAGLIDGFALLADKCDRLGGNKRELGLG